MKWRFMRSEYTYTGIFCDSANDIFERGFQDSS